jgi:Fe-S cluster assembly protein SufD
MEHQYIDFYKEYHTLIKQHSAALMNNFRDAAFEKFERLGFPTSKLENYKYTDMSVPLSIEYGLNINRLQFKSILMMFLSAMCRLFIPICFLC